MLKASSLVFAVAGLALALSACGSSEEAAAPDSDTKPEIALSPIQKANFERFNRKDFLKNLQALEEKAPAKDAAAPAEGAENFASLDKDSSGKLDPAEFALAKLPAGSAADDATTEEVIRSFFSLDNDGDSNLTEEEFAAAAGSQEDEGLAAGEASASEG